VAGRPGLRALAIRATTRRPLPLNGRGVIEFTRSERTGDPRSFNRSVVRSLSVGVDDRPWKQSSTIFARCPASYISRADAALPLERNKWAGGILEAFVFGWLRPVYRGGCRVCGSVDDYQFHSSSFIGAAISKGPHLSSRRLPTHESATAAHPTAASSEHRTKLSRYAVPSRTAKAKDSAASS